LTALRWKLARLSAMSAGEIGHRARVALRGPVAPKAYASWTPGRRRSACTRAARRTALASSLLPRWAHALEPAEECRGRVAAARGLLGWALVGVRVAKCGSTIRRAGIEIR
jgi:hypothetical protein